MRRRATITLLGFAAVALLAAAAPPPQQEKDPWAPLEFLLGTWSGPGSGEPGQAVSGSTTFSLGLDRKVMIRENHVAYAPKPGEKAGVVHDDLMIIYRNPGEAQFRAIDFDNEGHVIHYTLCFPGQRTGVIFDSEGGAKEPRFRLVYEAAGDGSLSVEFLVAPPGGELKSYVKGTVRKKA